ncbi:MAG: transposase [Gammaproteobacteria bacterium]|nr:transposase [Gammaproteobacteria bacterium]
MRKSRFTESQIVAILKEADTGMKVSELGHQRSIPVATYYTWKSKYDGMDASDLKRAKELESENAGLKRMYAELAFEKAPVKDLYRKKTLAPAGKRDAARFLAGEHQLSIVKACRCVGLQRLSFYRVPPCCTLRDAGVIAALPSLVKGRPNLRILEVAQTAQAVGQDLKSQTQLSRVSPGGAASAASTKKRLPKRVGVPLYAPEFPERVRPQTSCRTRWPRDAGFAPATQNDPMIPWAIARPRKYANQPESLHLRCLVDREAYASAWAVTCVL